MDQKDKDASRKAIQAQKEQEEDNALSGIIDNEKKRYTFQHTIHTADGAKEGTFTARIMSVMDRLALGSQRAKLLGGAPLASIDGVTDDIAYMIAFLQVTLVDSPDWFDFDVMEDLSDLYDLFYEVKAFQDRFRSHSDQGANVRDSEIASSTTAVEGE